MKNQIQKNLELENVVDINNISISGLQELVNYETAKRKIIKEFIANHLKNNVDYGKIHIAKNCIDKYNCRIKSHYSKNILFKSGAEKFISLFRLRAKFEKDNATYEMAGSPVGLFCYICKLYTSDNKLVGEGRGACSINDKGDANIAIKIAEKRAKLDAVLATGALSDFFTQDEDLVEMAETTTDVQKQFVATLKWAREQTDTKKIADVIKRLEKNEYFDANQRKILAEHLKARIKELKQGKK